MNPYYQDKCWTILLGDCREVMPSGGSAIVTDPPYGLTSKHGARSPQYGEGGKKNYGESVGGFMGMRWDGTGVEMQKETWEIIRKSCLSGSPLLSFGGTRTFHRIACAIEDAGWEIRDTLMWVYGQGFPKSLDISKAIDKAKGTFVEGDETPNSRSGVVGDDGNYNHSKRITLSNPQSPEAQLWEGYGTALKPAYEPIILAMNPLDGTFANNALKHGVAGLNIDECRIAHDEPVTLTSRTADKFGRTHAGGMGWRGKPEEQNIASASSKGRFPSNFIHDGSQMVLELFPQSQGAFAPVRRGQNGKSKGIYGDYAQKGDDGASYYGDNGSAARFFYTAKASFDEREKGLIGHIPCHKCGQLSSTEHQAIKDGIPQFSSDGKPIMEKCRRNTHPTVKALALMEYLIKLVKMPEYNLIIDPFMGSGTTLLACIRLGIPCIGIDNDEKTCEIAARRCSQEVMELV